MPNDEMARRIHETHAAPTADIPLAPARPVPPVGQHPAFEQPCDALGCDALTACFCASRDHRIIHYCAAHEGWALAQTRLAQEGWYA